MKSPRNGLKMLERDIEKKVNKYAASLGWLVYKFVSPNRRGVPDRMYLRHGVAMFVEFKQTGKKPTALQAKEMRKLREHGFRVVVIDDVEQGREYFDNWGLG